MDKQFEVVNIKFDKVDKSFENVDKQLKKSDNKLEITTNSNLAQILVEQAREHKEQEKFSKELIEKIDSYMMKNEVEHKKFEYKIADIEMKQKIVN